MFLTVCLNPTLQRTIVLSHLWEGEVHRTAEHYIDASGKGVNVTRVLHQLGEAATHLTQCGGADGERFLALARADGLTVRTVATDQDVRTCTTLLNRERGTTTEIVEEGRPVQRHTEDSIREEYLSILGQSHTVIISGSKAPGFSAELFPWMVKKARSRDAAVVIDYRGQDLLDSLPYQPTVIKPNLSEFLRTFHPSLDILEGESQDAAVDLASRKITDLYAEYGVMTVLTRGRFETLYCADGTVERLRPPDATIVNTIGSGDAFTAGLASALRKRATLKDAVESGHRCAVQNASRLRPGVIA